MKTHRTLVQRSPCWYEAHVCDGSSKSRLDGPGDAFQLPHLAQGPTMSLSDREQFNCLLLSALGRLATEKPSVGVRLAISKQVERKLVCLSSGH